MKSFARFFVGSVLIAVLVLLSAATAWAQTSNSALVLGIVTDPAGAVVPDATVSLTNTATNEIKTTTTNSAGQYVFPNVSPGTYTLKISKSGFAIITFSNIQLNVTKSYTYDAKLEVSSGKETVEVTAGAVAELQTTDAVVGNVIGGTTLSRLPTLTRSASELMTLQPGSTPFDSAQTGFGDTGGTVTGARSDQNTFSLDGIDITDNVIAGGGFQTPIIPIGVDSVDEFRVGVTNNNAAFQRSSGGLVSLVSKSGTNDLHGAAYWFHQNDELNANSWENNHLKDPLSGEAPIKRAETRDNRAGLSVGGPFIKNRTFFYANYEVRRFFQSFNFVRVVPTDLLKQGTLQFRDCSAGFSGSVCQGGTLRSYDLQSSSLCGADSNGQPLNLPCDPRGLGISRTVHDLWNLLPSGNDPSAFGADGNNSIGFRSTVPAPLKDDFVAFKLDHNFTQKVHFFGRYMYSRDLTPSGTFNGGQIDFSGGAARTSSNQFIRGDGFIAGLDWQIRSNLTNSFHAGWIRSRQDFTVIRPRDSAKQLALPQTDSALGTVALAPGLVGTFPPFLDTVIDVDTQRARHQAIYDSNKQYRDDVTWVKGKHTVVAGAEVRWLPTIHDRDDKVIGSVNSLVAGLDADVGLGLRIPSANRPPACIPANLTTGAPAVTTNCLQPADQQRWDRLYAASLGLVDNVGMLIVRDGQLNPQPLGDSLIARTTLRAYDFYLQDTWRIRPSLTLTYGLGYGWQTTPHERDGKQTFIVDHDNGDKIVSGFDYIKAKQKAAESGQTYNPNLGYLPIKNSGRSDVYSIDFGDVAPRASLAWNPSFRSGFLGKLIGERKTVIRGGYGISYDRTNTVQSVIIPMLGVGFAQTINVITPPCNKTGPGGTNCGINTTPGGSIFRVGVDGSIPVPPSPTASTSPVIPVGSAATVTYGEILSFQDDPDFKIGRSHMFDFTVQREIPGNMLMEVGYVGRLGRDLGNSINFNSSPYMFKDKASGQSFAQAFDAVATALRNNQTPGSQPWFENQFPSNMPALVGCGATNTECMVNILGPNFINGNVSSMFIVLDLFRDAFGLPTYNNHQVLELFMRTHRDKSNYHALFFTLRNRGWHGLQFDMNYTFSKSLDQSGAVQNDARYYASSYSPNLEYGPSFFDRTHVFNALYNYDLPFGKGHRLGSSYAAVNKFIGGWYTAGIWRFATGLPLTVTNGGDTFGGGLIFATPGALIPLVNPSTLESGAHFGVTGSGGIGTAGDPANGGSGVNYFADPEKASKQFRQVLLASDGRTGRGRPLRGFNFWNWDARIGKVTPITERVKTEFSFDFFNVLNHVIFVDPAFDLTTPTNFGVVSTQYVPANRNAGSRWIQFGLRVNF